MTAEDRIAALEARIVELATRLQLVEQACASNGLADGPMSHVQIPPWPRPRFRDFARAVMYGSARMGASSGDGF